MKHPHYWVIKSKKKHGKDIWGNPATLYFARRTSLKNKRFATDFHIQVKWFVSKDEAEKYYFAKLNQGFDLSKYIISRKKLFLDKKGKYDYWKNREALKK